MRGSTGLHQDWRASEPGARSRRRALRRRRERRQWFFSAPVAVILLVAVGGLAAALVRGSYSQAVDGGSGQPAQAALPLAGRVVVLDPGHNGGNWAAADEIARTVEAGGFTKPCDTAGASTNDGYPEHAFTFDVATRLASLLRADGATVLLTRADNNGVGPCVDERARMGNDANADAVVSIHADGAGPGDSGFHVIAPGLSPDGGNSAILADSARLAEAIRAAFLAAGEPVADYIGNGGMDERADLAGLNLSRVPKVFVECANMRNAADAARVTDPAWRQRAAQGLAQGIRAYLAPE